jgi:hypothetical protein
MASGPDRDRDHGCSSVARVVGVLVEPAGWLAAGPGGSFGVVGRPAGGLLWAGGWLVGPVVFENCIVSASILVCCVLC